MENQNNVQLADLETILTAARDQLLQDVQKTALDNCILDLKYLTESLESIVSKDSAALIGTGSAADITKAVEIIRAQIAEFFREHGDALSVMLPTDKIEALDPLLTRFSLAVNQFEILANKFIVALESYESPELTGPIN